MKVITNKNIYTYYKKSDSEYRLVNKEKDKIIPINVKGKINFIKTIDGTIPALIFDNEDLFLVNYTDESELDESKKIKLAILNKYGDVMEKFIVDTPNYEECYLGYECYRIEGNTIYSLRKNCKHRFSEIIQGEEVSKNIGKNNALVRNRFYDNRSGIEEVITYVVDLKNFDVVSQIHSKMQNRFIPLYTDKETSEFHKKYKRGLPYMGFTDENEDIKYLQNNGCETIVYEVIRPFKIVARELRVDDPIKSKEIESFIKRLGDKNDNQNR